jgi:hypothetical protein
MRPAEQIKDDRLNGWPTPAVRGLILLYFLLLIAEGAFRKWITPGLSAPLLVVRDPVVLLIYLVAGIGGFFPRNPLVLFLGVCAVLGAGAGALAEVFDLKVYLFGLRTNFLHFPLIFVAAEVMDYHDVVRLGKWIVLLSLPMTLLVVQQFSAAPDDVINAAAGGALGEQLGTAGGKVRASGTFSYVAGVIGLYGIVAGFLLNSLVRAGTYPRWLQLAGVVSVGIAAVTSGSRSVVAIVLASCIVVAATAVMKPQMLVRVIVTMAFLGVVGYGVMQLSVVEEGVSLTGQRFQESGGHQGFWPRLISPFYPLFVVPGEAPFFGQGLGLGTNAGAGLAGKTAFEMGEDDWSRVIVESGPIAGLLFVLWRMLTFAWLLFLGVQKMREGNLLPILMLTTAGSFILYGQIGQPTLLGFAAFGGGLCLAATRDERDHSTATGVDGLIDVAKERIAKRRRGRSQYAETLHGRRAPPVNR